MAPMIQKRSHHLAILLLCLLSTLLASRTLHAQFETNIKLNKDTYITYEGVEATVTIINRSGSDIVMGGPNGGPWLNFTVYEPTGRQRLVDLAANDPIIFKAGTTIARKVVISRGVAFSEYGNYAVCANVYHPPSQRFYSSNRVRALVVSASPFWQRPFGVPTGLPGAGETRRYVLCTTRDNQHTYLYAKVLNDVTETHISTISLGTAIMVTDPQVTIDRDNRLNVLFMTVPKIYAHVVIDPQGKVFRRNYHRETDDDRPRLAVNGDGSILVAGGIPFDPTMEAQAQQQTRGRSISEKPPGL